MFFTQNFAHIIIITITLYVYNLQLQAQINTIYTENDKPPYYQPVPPEGILTKPQAETIWVEIPVEYVLQKVTIKRGAGAYITWQPISCVIDTFGGREINVVEIKAALLRKGYEIGELNNTIDKELQDAIIQFYKNHPQYIPNTTSNEAIPFDLLWQLDLIEF